MTKGKQPNNRRGKRSIKENYRSGDNWANPVEIDGSWYILKHEKYEANMELVNELPEQNLDII